MADEAALAAWQARQQERKAQREKWTHEAKEYEVAQALKTLAKHGLISEGEDLAGLAKLREEHELFSQALIDLDDEVKEARLAVDADHQAAELARLQQGLRDRDWRDAWREIARESGMHERAIDHAWKHHGPPAETDEPDRQALGALVARLKTEHDYLWPAPAGGPEPATPPADQPAATIATNGVAHVFDRGGWRAN